jgi:flagellar assembly protein FliH
MASRLYRGGMSGSGGAETWVPGGTGGAPYSTAPSPAGGTSAADPRLHDLERQIQERVAAGHRRGVEEGQALGRQAAAAEVQTALERVARTIDEISSFRARMRHEAEVDVVKLAVAIARRVLNREIATDPEALLGLVRCALDKLDGRELHRVRANPQDAPRIQQYLDKMGGARKIELQADPSLPPGSAIFDTAQGALDASIGTQLGEIERGFADLVRRTP